MVIIYAEIEDILNTKRKTMAKYSPKTMQNGKIVNITDKMITLELKYNFYNSKKCSKFIDYKT